VSFDPDDVGGSSSELGHMLEDFVARVVERAGCPCSTRQDITSTQDGMDSNRWTRESFNDELVP